MGEQPQVALVGPGRVGSALGRRIHEARYAFMGFVSRETSRAEAGVRFVGAGQVLTGAALAEADMVGLCVAEDALASVVEQAAADGRVKQGSVWFHVSGLHGLAVLAPLQVAGAHVGSMHPVCPFPDARSGYEAMPGQPAVVGVMDDPEGGVTARGALLRLARAVCMEPVPFDSAASSDAPAGTSGGGERTAYHAACVLAASGASALCGVVEASLQSAGMTSVAARKIAGPLMLAALEARLAAPDPGSALSGPVARGEAEVLGRQCSALASSAPRAGALFQLLQSEAAEMAQQHGRLSPATAAAIQAALDQAIGEG